MNQSTITYAGIGAITFATLSAAAAKYRGDSAFEPKNLARDAVAGAIITAFLLTLVPDIFPKISLWTGATAALAVATSVLPKSVGGGSSDDSEFDLQVGYPKVRR
jgi:hypothetical protein